MVFPILIKPTEARVIQSQDHHLFKIIPKTVVGLMQVRQSTHIRHGTVLLTEGQYGILLWATVLTFNSGPNRLRIGYTKSTKPVATCAKSLIWIIHCLAVKNACQTQPNKEGCREETAIQRPQWRSTHQMGLFPDY